MDVDGEYDLWSNRVSEITNRFSVYYQRQTTSRITWPTLSLISHITSTRFDAHTHTLSRRPPGIQERIRTTDRIAQIVSLGIQTVYKIQMYFYDPNPTNNIFQWPN